MENKFELLRPYISINDNTSVQTRYATKDGVKPGKWVEIQRGPQNKLSTNRFGDMLYNSG